MKRSLRIGIVAPEYPPEAGGMQVYAYEVAGELGRRGHAVTVFTKKSQDNIPKQNNVKVLQLLEGQRCSDTVILRNAGPFDYWHVMNASWVWVALDIEPVVVSVHGNDFLNPNPVAGLNMKQRLGLVKGDRIDYLLAKWLTQRLMRRGFRRVKHIVTNSRYVMDAFLAKYPECQNRTSVGYVGVSREWLTAPLHTRSKIGSTRLLTVCRLSEPRKNVDVVLRALKLLKDKHDFTYRIVGDGVLRPALEELAKELDLSDRVTFLGFVDERALKEEMCLSDLFILVSSLSEKSVEGFGLVYLEANACGTPVIAARLGGAIDAVDEGVSGLCVDSPNPEQLAKVLQNIFSNDMAFSEIECREHASKFPWARVVDHIVKHYE